MVLALGREGGPLRSQVGEQDDVVCVAFAEGPRGVVVLCHVGLSPRRNGRSLILPRFAYTFNEGVNTTHDVLQ